MFMAGFSSAPSTIYWSDIAKPEQIEPEWFRKIRTDDGDVITAIKAGLGQLVVFKQRSMHKVVADGPDQVLSADVSLEYGCLSRNAVVVYEDRMWFLDRKGICEYNGARPKIVSSKVQDYFDRMNQDAAKLNATAIHFRDRNEVWFAIPIDGSTTNNITIVYNYLSDAWTTFKGFNASIFSEMRGRQTKYTTFFGDYSGMINNFGQTFTSDNGVGISLMARTGFWFSKAKSITEQFRRLWVNHDVPGSTQGLTIGFLQDFGSSVVLTRSAIMEGVQTRIDFGIPATSIAIEASAFTTQQVRVHGFAVDMRQQRRVSDA